MTTSHFRFFAIVCGLLVCALASFGLYQLWNRPVEAGLTPASYAPPLEKTADRLEVLVSHVPLAKAIAEQRLSITVDGNTVPVSAADVTVRLHEGDRVRIATVPRMLGLAAAAGAGFVLLVVGLLTPLIGEFRPHGLIDLHLPT